MSELPLFGTNIDKSQAPPLHQKRIIAFVNSFILETVEFLNKFAGKCENSLVNLEIKLNRVGTQLELIEAKLNSVPDLKDVGGIPKIVPSVPEVIQQSQPIITVELGTEPAKPEYVEQITQDELPQVEATIGVKAKDDYRYRKYFKMIHFGVPAPAVKQKLIAEGIDPDLLDTPDKILPDGVSEAPPQEDESDESD